MSLALTVFTCAKIFRQTSRPQSGKVVSGVGPNTFIKSIGKCRIHSSKGGKSCAKNVLLTWLKFPLAEKTVLFGTACTESARSSAKPWSKNKSKASATYCKHVYAASTTHLTA